MQNLIKILREVHVLEARVKKFLELKNNEGTHINDAITRNKEYGNPYVLKQILSLYGIDEYASNFDKSVYDPSAYISASQR